MQLEYSRREKAESPLLPCARRVVMSSEWIWARVPHCTGRIEPNCKAIHLLRYRCFFSTPVGTLGGSRCFPTERASLAKAGQVLGALIHGQSFASRTGGRMGEEVAWKAAKDKRFQRPPSFLALDTFLRWGWGCDCAQKVWKEKAPRGSDPD